MLSLKWFSHFSVKLFIDRGGLMYPKPQFAKLFWMLYKLVCETASTTDVGAAMSVATSSRRGFASALWPTRMNTLSPQRKKPWNREFNPLSITKTEPAAAATAKRKTPEPKRTNSSWSCRSGKQLRAEATWRSTLLQVRRRQSPRRLLVLWRYVSTRPHDVLQSPGIMFR